MNVLYTSLLYKNRKIKPWSDGTLKVKQGKSQLYDSLGNLIDSSWKGSSTDSLLTMEKYLVDVQNQEQVSDPIPSIRKRKFKPLSVKKIRQTQVLRPSEPIEMSEPQRFRHSPNKLQVKSKPLVHKPKPQTCFSSWRSSDSDNMSDSVDSPMAPKDTQENYENKKVKSQEKEFTNLFFPSIQEIQNTIIGQRGLNIPNRFRNIGK